MKRSQSEMDLYCILSIKYHSEKGKSIEKAKRPVVVARGCRWGATAFPTTSCSLHGHWEWHPSGQACLSLKPKPPPQAWVGSRVLPTAHAKASSGISPECPFLRQESTKAGRGRVLKRDVKSISGKRAAVSCVKMKLKDAYSLEGKLWPT